jgi:hypothetical protein
MLAVSRARIDAVVHKISRNEMLSLESVFDPRREKAPSGCMLDYRMAMADITAQILTEIRDEAREAHAETRENFKTVFHRLALMEASMDDVRQRLTSLERHMAALLSIVPAMNDRIDRLEARVALLENRTP